MVDIVNLALVVAQGRDVLHRVEEVFRAKRHLILAHGLPELAIESESADLAEPIAVRVEKLLGEEGLGLLFIRWIARPQPYIELQKRLFMTLAIVLGKRGQNHRITNLVDHFNLSRRTLGLFGLFGFLLICALASGRRQGRLDDRDFVAELRPGVYYDFAGFRIHDRLDGPHCRCKFVKRDFLRLIEKTQDVPGRAVPGVDGSQENCSGDLAGLVDLDGQDVFVRNPYLYPTASFGYDPAAVQHPVALFALDKEINAGTAVQLAYYHPHGPVNYKLPAAYHNRHFAQVHRLFGRIFAVLGLQPAMDLERIAVSQAKLPALPGSIVRLLQLVTEIFQLHTLVVALDGEYLLKQRFKTEMLSSGRHNLLLQKVLVTFSLYRHQVRDLNSIVDFAKITNGS